MVENEKVIVSINGQKIEQAMDALTLNMPSEAATLLSLMKSQVTIDKISGTSLDLKSIIETDTTSSSALIRKVPDALAAVVEQRKLIDKIRYETNPEKKYMIDESGVALEIIVGSTKKSEIAEIMKFYSKSVPSNDEIFYFYHDLSLSIFFDYDDIVSEMKFGSLYKGKTRKGLSIGDTVEKAIEIYGQPKLKSPKGAIWDKLAIFCEKNLITSIRIQK